MNIIIEEIVNEYPIIVVEEVVRIEISDTTSFLDLVDVADKSYTGKNGYVPVVNEVTKKLELKPQSGGGGGGAVDSVFGRTGAVIAQSGDYNASQVGAPSGSGTSTGTNTGDQDLSGYALTSNVDTALSGKVDKVTGKSLIDDTEISRLASMTAIFTTALKLSYDGAVTSLSNLLATGSRLITSGEIAKLSNTSGTNTGDNATNTTSNAYADAKVADTITDGVTTVAPSQNAVFDALSLKADKSSVGNLLREEFTFSGSQTITLANNYGQVYSVQVQGQGALSTSQYTLVAPNQITITDTLESGDYIVVLYSTTATGVQPYYSQAQTDALINPKIGNIATSGIQGSNVTGTVSEVILYSKLIPANTLKNGDVINLSSRVQKLGGNGVLFQKVYINTANSLSGSIRIASNLTTAINQLATIERVFSLDGNLIIGASFTSNFNSDVTNTFALLTATFNPTVDNYIFIAGTLGSALDTMNHIATKITN